MFTCFRVFGYPLKLLLRATWVLKEFDGSVEPLQSDHLGRGQKKLTVVERWPLWEGGGDYMTFFREYNMSVIVLSSCLLCSVIIVILSYLIYTQKLELCLESKC